MFFLPKTSKNACFCMYSPCPAPGSSPVSNTCCLWWCGDNTPGHHVTLGTGQHLSSEWTTCQHCQHSPSEIGSSRHGKYSPKTCQEGMETQEKMRKYLDLLEYLSSPGVDRTTVFTISLTIPVAWVT